MTKATRTKYVIRHKDGYYINVRLEPKDDFMRVDRWSSVDDIHDFLHSHYAPEHPEDYEAVPINITYEVEELQ